MLPPQHKLTRSVEFRTTMRRGAKYGCPFFAVHVLAWNNQDGSEDCDGNNQPAPVRFGGPRFGLIVSKAVGNAVVRHRVARRLRHICMNNLELFPTNSTVVIRAFPAISTARATEEALTSALQAAAHRAETKGYRSGRQQRGSRDHGQSPQPREPREPREKHSRS